MKKHKLTHEFENADDLRFCRSICQVMTDPMTRATAAKIRSGSMPITYEGRSGMPLTMLGPVEVPLVDLRRLRTKLMLIKKLA